MADKDFYDRIADALEIISGDDSHVDNVDKNMDYYKRIAEALENIADAGGSGGGGSSNDILTITMSSQGSQYVLDKTWTEITESKFATVKYEQLGSNQLTFFGFVSQIYTDIYTNQRYVVVTIQDNVTENQTITFLVNDNEYPTYFVD